MTSPGGPDGDDFLVTTVMSEKGQVTTEYVSLKDVTSELLAYYASQGHEAAAAELAARMGIDGAPEETDVEPDPETETETEPEESS